MDFEPLRSRAATPFQSVGIFGHALANIMIAAGIAAGPWLLPRNGTTVSVYDARKSLAWAVFFFGFIAVTLAALAIFVRHFAMTDLVGRAATDLPEWFTALRDLGLAAIGKGETVLGLSSFAIKRDAVLAALPLAAGAPPIVLYLVLAGVVAAGLAAIAATSHTIAALLSEDVVTGLRWDPPADAYRLGIKRVMAVLVVLVGMAFVAIVETDPLRLVFWALGITASTAFPVVILSVWWKRLTPTGAIAAIGTGFLVAVMSILMSGYELLSVPSELAASLGIAPAFVAAILASRATVLPAREVLEQVRDMRVPGGETVYDREMRLLRQRQLTSRS